MKRRIWLLIAGGGTILCLAAVAYHLMPAIRGQRHSGRLDFAVMVSPPGVTLTMIGNPVEIDGVSYLRPDQDGDVLVERPTVFSDARGLPFYTYDNDTPGHPTCAGDCLKLWPAAIAPTDAKPVGDWSLIARDDGSTQWAYRAKPLYRFADDRVPGDAKGDGADHGAWHALIFKAVPEDGGHGEAAPRILPAVLGTLPFGISVHEIEAAGGQVLTDNLNRTLYAFDGDPTQDRPACKDKAQCPDSPWLPVRAPALANGIDNFAIVKRADGTGQWAYRGWPLYRYAADAVAGQANGVGVDPRWRPAVVVRYPTPAPVTLQSTATMGTIFATTDGRSLYRQFVYYYAAEAGNFEHGYPYYEIIGRLLGGRGCVDDCLKSWRPFIAAPEAQPAGHWSIVMRPDGTRQWAYKGYALYTFEGDKKPGDLLGLDNWDITPNDPALHHVSLFSRLNIDAESVTGMFFTTAYP